ncbi:MAG: C40 family peptidase [Fluviicola sp.]|nr:C40 family peptidase [Fluviicola sp.]
MGKYFLLIVGFLFSFQSFGQNPKIDKLEMLFSQKHYKRVHRKANRLLDNPEYDFSMMPSYYKSLSLFELAQNKFWLMRHSSALKDAKKLFLEVKHSENGTKIFNAHMYEIAWLKSDLISWASDLKRMGEGDQFLKVQAVIEDVFGDFDLATLPDENVKVDKQELQNSPENAKSNDLRSSIIAHAKNYIGVPYVWAGSSPKGFDCSGFTSYMMQDAGKKIPRRSSDQYTSANKIKKKDVQKGDLVFFDNGSGISHVGLVISEKGKPLTMIHSSSSKGIIITNVETSKYWSQRLSGYGSYLE